MLFRKVFSGAAAGKCSCSAISKSVLAISESVLAISESVLAISKSVLAVPKGVLAISKSVLAISVFAMDIIENTFAPLPVLSITAHQNHVSSRPCLIRVMSP